MKATLAISTLMLPAVLFVNSPSNAGPREAVYNLVKQTESRSSKTLPSPEHSDYRIQRHPGAVTFPSHTQPRITQPTPPNSSHGQYQPLMKFTGNMEPGGMRILRVEADGPAYQMGLERGDLILSINRRGFDTHSEFHELVNYYNPRLSTLVKDVRTGLFKEIKGFVPAPSSTDVDTSNLRPHTPVATRSVGFSRNH